MATGAASRRSFEPLLDAPDVTDVEKVGLPLGDAQGFTLKSALSPAECRHYVGVIEELGNSAHNWSKDGRANSRFVADSPGLAAVLWKRIARFLPDVVVESEVSEGSLEPFAPGGVWKPSGLNERFKACMYTEGEQFGPHCDASFVRSHNERSWKALMLFLNDDFEGGETDILVQDATVKVEDRNNMLVSSDQIQSTIGPEPGLGLVLNSSLMHQDAMVSKGYKYILRTEVMYKREGGREMGPKDVEALSLFQKALDAEGEGEMGIAASLYTRAFKMSPGLAKAYGQGGEGIMQ